MILRLVFAALATDTDLAERAFAAIGETPCARKNRASPSHPSGA